MKKIVMIKADYCPYCRQAGFFMDQLKKDKPDYCRIPIEYIDEIAEPDKANRYEYRVVPTYYIDGRLIFTGVPTIQDIDKVFSCAMND